MLNPSKFLNVVLKRWWYRTVDSSDVANVKLVRQSQFKGTGEAYLDHKEWTLYTAAVIIGLLTLVVTITDRYFISR